MTHQEMLKVQTLCDKVFEEADQRHEDITKRVLRMRLVCAFLVELCETSTLVDVRVSYLANLAKEALDG